MYAWLGGAGDAEARGGEFSGGAVGSAEEFLRAAGRVDSGGLLSRAQEVVSRTYLAVSAMTDGRPRVCRVVDLALECDFSAVARAGVDHDGMLDGTMKHEQEDSHTIIYAYSCLSI